MSKLSAMIIVSLSLAASACSKDEDKPASGNKPTAPPAAKVEPKPAPAPAPTPTVGTIPEVAAAAGSFKTLLAAVEAAGLAATLSGTGPFTVFAPTDDAFAKIPKADLDALLADKAKLTAVLTYHVVAGKVMASDVGALKSAKTVQGAELAIDTSSGVKIGGATVIKADIEASNGVIHVIDTVLLPPM